MPSPSEDEEGFCQFTPGKNKLFRKVDAHENGRFHKN